MTDEQGKSGAGAIEQQLRSDSTVLPGGNTYMIKNPHAFRALKKFHSFARETQQSLFHLIVGVDYVAHVPVANVIFFFQIAACFEGLRHCL